MKKWIKEHKNLSITVAVIAVIAIIAAMIVIVKVNQTAKALQDAAKEQETAKVEKRTLMESLSATGTFVASDETGVTSETINTKVLSVNVSVGDTVNAGDVICTLDTTELQKDLSDAKQSLADAQEQRQRTIDGANRSLSEAETNRKEALNNLDTSISDAQQDWQDAQAQLDSLNAQKNAADAAGSALESAKLEGEIRIAQTSVDRAKRTYDTLVQNRDSNIKTINDTYQNQADSCNTTIENASASTDMQQEQVDRLQEQIDQAVVTAPARGLVTALNVKSGDHYNGGMIAVVKNVDTFEVTAEIDEYDVNKVQVGQEVVIKTNADEDLELSGTVKSIAPAATGSTSVSDSGAALGLDLENLMDSSSMVSGSNDVAFTVRVSVNTPCDQIKLGMTAKLSIVLEKGENVLSIPYNALQGDSEEGYYIEEVTKKDKNGTYQTTKVSVNKGLENDYYVEITGAEVKEGMEILVPKAEEETSIVELLEQTGAMGGI